MRFFVEYNPEISRECYDYENTCTIKEMLEDFLRKTDSKMTLAPSDICFIYNAKILNNERFLNKRLHEVFKYHKVNIIRFSETKQIMGD